MYIGTNSKGARASSWTARPRTDRRSAPTASSWREAAVDPEPEIREQLLAAALGWDAAVLKSLLDAAGDAGLMGEAWQLHHLSLR
jgi:hypothetical protein